MLIHNKLIHWIQYRVDRPCSRSACAISKRQAVAPSQFVCRARLPMLGIALLWISGCGGSEYSLAPVSGAITLKGKPLANAQVVFSPADGQLGPSSFGTTDDQGQYQLTTLDHDKTGAVIGTHRVTITTAHSSDPDDERAPISKELVPRRYRDGSFQMEVPTEGRADANVDVATK